ncbi:MAG: aldehyde ferredoxin oxidoreductase C-terminal domain-containing protein [Syntrophorhabdales bacterium]|jgi:aldehyde:ferredoxin oxidoreductase
MNIVKVDMTEGIVSKAPFPRPGRLDHMLGGRAVIDRYLTDHVSPRVHPLSERSPFIVAPGFLAGSSAPSANRLSVGGKSPLTGGIKEANVGGTAGSKLGRLAIQAIVVEGRASRWQLLKLDNAGIGLEPADFVMGLDNYEACERLRERYGKKIGVLIIGPAGERLSANSTVAATDPEGRPSRHAARGGVGAVMGAKRLKGIVIDDAGTTLRRAVDEKAFRAAVKTTIETMRAGGPYGEILRASGTPWFVDLDNARGSLQTHNYRLGSFDKVKDINASKFIELNKVRGGTMGHACSPGCVIHCSNIFHDADGRYVTSSLEYETLTFLGANLGIGDLDAIARMDRRCDGIGIDTIETGAAIGILNDVGLFDFGDAARAEELIEEIAQGTLMGRILAAGTEVVAKVFGIDRVPTVKGQAIAAHSGRSMKGWGVTYATSPQGADHTAGPVGAGDFLNPKGQVEASRNSQIINTALDATGFCHFAFMYRYPQVIMPMVNAFCGTDLAIEDFLELGKEMLLQERAFNLGAGIGPGADGMPEFTKTEPLPPTNAVFDVPDEEIQDFFNF